MSKRIARLRPVSLACAALTALSAAGCDVQTYEEAAASFYENAPPPPSPPPDPPPSGPNFGPVFSEIQAAVFTPTCATANCHSGANPPASLNLEAANSHAMLVGMPSSQDPGIQRVAPGNPNLSYLVQKLEGTAASGGQMPPSGALDQADIDVIRQWITDGAIDDTVQPAAPIRVASLSPTPDAVLDASPNQIVAGFDRDLDASTVNATTFVLRASGGDASFNDGNETNVVAASITVPGANPASAVFDLGGQALADDTYRVVLAGAGASLIMDLDANALDGEFSGAFPSGNGVAGGNFVAQFSVATPVVIQPTLADIHANVFAPSCVSCHNPAGSASAVGIDFTDTATSHLTLVNVPSAANAMIMRVVPGDPDNSYLVHKLENTGNVGVMPPTGGLPQSTIDVVRQWIADGAQP